ncbi:MBL fold metallo-hydrolase [Planotetraspora sp. A-T 1434]|uniref:MBL fold metallo-hydrolase n=1 Tax=Planotetraspora sp. A-T 1434 TaxID=2979219 RepID=UPI0021C05636|nr:MBL fold metallo-hydrolase [Planotetraspora sp. A-T 1434]MCT9930232.1 MBL fold metallo-hydrolase [Planotetraspora sp. A-T 1434]
MADARMWRFAAGALALAAVGWAVRDVPAALGARPSGERARRVRRSRQFRGSAFQNATPSPVLPPGTAGRMAREFLFGRQRRTPRLPVPLVTPTPNNAPNNAAGSDLDVVWYGHSSALVEIEGRRVLFDPVWSERCSPSSLVGPRRLHPPPVALHELPEVDAIVISHDHYDHLDMATVRTLVRTQSAPFLVPLGVGAHLERWRVPASRIVELDWEEEASIAGLRFVATAAHHFSGRLFVRNPTLWTSWVIAGERRRVFYTGDSGYFDGYAAIGEAHGPFDLALIQIGAYSPGWPDIHMTPEEAILAHLDVRARLLLPVHWGTFNLALHAWGEPVDRLWREAKARDVHLVVPRPGERFSVDDPPPVDGWWQTIA